MVGVKPPPRLEDAAREALANYVASVVVEYLAYDTPRLMRGIEHLQSTIFDNVCSAYYGKFVRNVLRQMSSQLSSESVRRYEKVHGTDWLTIFLDVWKTEVLEPLTDVCPRLNDLLWRRVRKDLWRMQNLKKFHSGSILRIRSLTDDVERLSLSFRMENLTTFIHRHFCDDNVLRFVASSCPNLVNLDVSDSVLVTEDGLNALNGCSKLTMLDINECRPIRGASISKFLARNPNVSVLKITEEHLCEILSLRTIIYHPLVDTLIVHRGRDVLPNLSSIVSVFPNLRSLSICPGEDNLDALVSLPRLADLSIMSVESELWKPLVGIRGNVVRELGVCSMDDSDLDLIHLQCPNLEVLFIKSWTGSNAIVFPEFVHLRELKISWGSDPHSFHTVEFTTSGPLALEKLLLGSSKMESDDIESMLTNSFRFPKLKLLVVYELRDLNGGYIKYAKQELIKFVTNNNLDIKIIVREHRRYIQ